MRQMIRDEIDDDLDSIYHIAKLLRDLNEQIDDDQQATEIVLSIALALNGLKQRALTRKRRMALTRKTDDR